MLSRIVVMVTLLASLTGCVTYVPVVPNGGGIRYRCVTEGARGGRWVWVAADEEYAIHRSLMACMRHGGIGCQPVGCTVE